MRDFLTEYQAAALQVMGIPVWKLNDDREADNATDKSVTEQVTQSSTQQVAKNHSTQWQTDNAAFIADVGLAINHVRTQMGMETSVTLDWLESDSSEFRITANKVYAPLDLTGLTAIQKQQLWTAIQQSCEHAN